MDAEAKKMIKTIQRSTENQPCQPHLHTTLDGDSTNDRDVFIIGDVHGCLDELKQLLHEAGTLTSGGDLINDGTIVILAGDLVNKGPYSRQTLQYIQTLGQNLYCIRGNHEDITLRELDHKPKCHWSRGLTSSDLDFLRNMPYTISLPSLGAIVVHAGFLPATAIEDQTIRTMTWTRNIVMNTSGPHSSHDDIDRGQHWAQLWQGPQHVYYGHDSKRGLDKNGEAIIQRHDFATGMDTACVAGGYLSGIFISGVNKDNVISVKARNKYKK